MAFTSVDDASLYFRVKTYSGSSSDGNAVTWDETHANMQPDWLWLKNRTAAQEHWLADVVRGTGKFLESNSVNAESSDGATGLASFDTNGFTVNDSARTNRNTMVGWGWKAGGSGSSNSDGSVTSTVSANTTAGFSICGFTQASSGSFTFGHGLGVAPNMVIGKSRGNNSNWQIFHTTLGTGKFIQLNTTQGTQTVSDFWGTINTSIVTVGSNQLEASQPSVYYCFAEKKGYSKFGSYVGNSSSDGPFIFTGFAPSFVLGRNTSRTEDWFMLDNKRDTFNPVDQRLQPNTTGTESTVTTLGIDFCSNGFKLKGATNQYNTSGETMIYMAFAESPFVNSNGVPNNAR